MTRIAESEIERITALLQKTELESIHQRVLQTALREKSSLDDVASDAEHNNAEFKKYTHTQLHVKY